MQIFLSNTEIITVIAIQMSYLHLLIRKSMCSTVFVLFMIIIIENVNKNGNKTKQEWELLKILMKPNIVDHKPKCHRIDNTCSFWTDERDWMTMNHAAERVSNYIVFFNFYSAISSRKMDIERCQLIHIQITGRELSFNFSLISSCSRDGKQKKRKNYVNCWRWKY